MNETTKRAPCPRCGETECISILALDPGENIPTDWWDQCDVCHYIYEDCWQSYPWLANNAKAK